MKNNWKIIDHPLVNNYLNILRNKNSDHKNFVEAFQKIVQLTVYPVTQYLNQEKIIIETTFAKMESKKTTTLVTLIPIMRAGLGMVDAYTEMLEDFQIGHILVQRERVEEEIKIKKYFAKIPKLKTEKDNLIIILEPMIASAATLTTVIEIIKKNSKITNKRIIIVCFLISKYAQKKIETIYQNLTIFTIQIDPILNKKKYIVPGIGDVGDLFFNT